jgi:hypothetical protein
LKSFRLPLLGEEDQPAKYRVKLYFAALDQDPCGPVQIRLQGMPAGELIDVASQVGSHRAMTREYMGIEVQRDLVVELSSEDLNRPATIAAVEVIREEP